MPKGERFYYRHAKKVKLNIVKSFLRCYKWFKTNFVTINEILNPILIKVVDGTTCDLKDGIRRICVEGKCVQVRSLSMYPLK